MSGNTVTHQTALTAERSGPTRAAAVAPSRAARELGLKRSEFDLAVRLGRIRTVPDDGGGGRRVPRDEIDRIRAADGFPEGLRAAVRAVGTTEGAALMDVTKARFTRLARLGLLVPVKFYVNRYRAVVWLYLAEELRRFTADERNAALLKGRTPAALRDQLGEGVDLRPRNWRGRHLGFLLRQAADDPWARAAAVASLLDAAEVSDVVTDPYERSHLRRFRPARSAHGSPGSPAAQLAEEIETAADQDEIDWLRSDLADAVEAARRQCPAPRPAPHAVRESVSREPRQAESQKPCEAEQPGRLSGLLGLLWRRGS
ncbi:MULTISPECIES: DUF6397 family protein [unclassified Streptomyces]|uniref:DUF6397 family protein n=1 Tax=unclassified Streptomyces TaxID=2593676 RepID=UPI001F1D6719|nr:MULTISPECIES: DUF6397 family protein [unclassified Streptomyces]WKX22476.1 DUF6397 family protein [Streptomyces sp. HUAS CX7]